MLWALAALPAELPAALLLGGRPQRGPLGLRLDDAVAVAPRAAPAALHAERVARHVLSARSALNYLVIDSEVTQVLSIVAEGNWDFLYQPKAFIGELRFMECLNMIDYFYRWQR